MKTKILLIFVLFTISLFGQVRIEDDTLYIRALDEDKSLHCEIICIDTGGWGISFIEIDEQIIRIKADNFEYYFKAIEMGDDYGFWVSTTASLDSYTQKKMLKDIINSPYILVSTVKKTYAFNFNKYKKELENNAFYKKIMQ